MIILGDKKRYKVKINRFEDGLFQAYIDDEDGMLMGEISFKIKSGKTWIYNIATEEAYQHNGIGQALIYVCEYMSATRNVKLIEGKYYPSNEFAKPFYDKNGYEIIKEGYETFIQKSIVKCEVLEKLEPLIVKEEITFQI